MLLTAKLQMLAKMATLPEYHTWVRHGALKRKMFGMSGGGHKGHFHPGQIFVHEEHVTSHQRHVEARG